MKRSTRTHNALFDAAIAGNVEELSAAAYLHASLDVRYPEHDETLLTLSVESGNVNAVQWLIAKGLPIDACDRYGRTPLMIAACAQEKHIVQALLDANASVNARDKEGRTALFYAVEQGSAEIVALLLSYNANPAEVDRGGETPIEIASNYGFLQIVAMLTHAP